MKTLFQVLALAVLATVAAQAQTAPIYSPQTAISFTSITNATTVNPTNIVLDVRKQGTVAIQTSTVAVGAYTDDVIFTVTRSVDGTTYETTGTTITNTSNGTTAVVVVSEVDTKGVGYIKLQSIANAGATGLGAVSVKWGLKIP
jgi:uncharacterized lipoprotein YajG